MNMELKLVYALMEEMLEATRKDDPDTVNRIHHERLEELISVMSREQGSVIDWKIPSLEEI